MIKPYIRYKWKDYWATTIDLDIDWIKIDKWFIFDGISVPKIIWGFIPPLSIRYLKLAIKHDYLYSCKYDWPINRKEADEIFRDDIDNKIFSNIWYAWVRVFGGLHYKKPLPFKKEEFF